MELAITGQKMRTAIFNRLMELADCQTGSDTATIGFESSFNGWHLSFYADLDNDYKVIVEDFGHFAKKNFVQCEPTESQLRAMTEKIRERAEAIRAEKLREEADAEAWRQEEADLAKYGHPGALYNKHY